MNYDNNLLFEYLIGKKSTVQKREVIHGVTFTPDSIQSELKGGQQAAV